MVTLNPSAKVNSSITSHSSDLNNVNMLQPNLFRLVVDRENYPNLEFFATGINHPSVDAAPAELQYQKVSRINFVADKLNYGDLNVNLVLDENMNSYIEMHNWITRMVQEDYRDPLGRNSKLPPIESDITIHVLSSHNNTLRKIKYIDCIPTTLGAVDFEAQNAEGYITYPISFRFNYFEIT